MKRQITRNQYIKAQDRLSKLQNEQVAAMRKGDQKKLDKANEKAVKQLAIIADYKDQQAIAR